MSHDNALVDAFDAYAVGRLRDCHGNVERCVRLLDANQIWQRPNDVSNSIGNLVLHLTGNVRQWILSGLAGEPDDRNRPGEFAERGPLPTLQILSSLRETIEQACRVIEKLDADSMIRVYSIQGRTVTGLAATFHVVEHFSFHTGQIVSTAKLLTGRDLSLYDPQGQWITPLSQGSV